MALLLALDFLGLALAASESWWLSANWGAGVSCLATDLCKSGFLRICTSKRLTSQLSREV